MSKTRPIVSLVGAAALAAGGLLAVQAAPASATGTTPTLNARSILNGKAHGWSQPDDLARIGSDLFVGFQNGVPSTGGTTGTPQKSTFVEFLSTGHIVRHINLTGKIDGMGADPAHQRVIVTVNEDGNSSLYTVGLNGAVHHYTYNKSPLPHGGGTDSVDVYQGRIYLAASNPSKVAAPAVYQVVLVGSTAKIVAEPIWDNSAAVVANVGQFAHIHLALTDPDSSTTVPGVAHRFGGTYMLDSQGDQEAIFATRLGLTGQSLRVLKLSQSVDDTTWATVHGGMLVTADATADSIVVITGPFVPGADYTSVTPGNANNAPANPGPNYLGTINLSTGKVTPVATRGVKFTTHGLIYVP